MVHCRYCFHCRHGNPAVVVIGSECYHLGLGCGLPGGQRLNWMEKAINYTSLQKPCVHLPVCRWDSHSYLLSTFTHTHTTQCNVEFEAVFSCLQVFLALSGKVFLVLSGQHGLSGKINLHSSHQINRGLSLSNKPPEILEPYGAIYLQLLTYTVHQTVNGYLRREFRFFRD